MFYSKFVTCSVKTNIFGIFYIFIFINKRKLSGISGRMSHVQRLILIVIYRSINFSTDLSWFVICNKKSILYIESVNPHTRSIIKFYIISIICLRVAVVLMIRHLLLSKTKYRWSDRVRRIVCCWWRRERRSNVK